VCYRVAGKHAYTNAEYPAGTPWNKGQIKKFVANETGTTPDSVIWPEHIKVIK